MKKYALQAFTALALIYAPPVFADGVCETFAHDMTKNVVSLFHDTTQNEAQKRTSLSAIFQEAVDTDWIGQFVLGRFWKSATPAQQQEYLRDYRTYLTHNYVSKFNDEDGMNVDDIVIASLTRAATAGTEAKTLIKRKGEEDVRVDYLLDEATGKCKVHDIKVEGVSLLTSQRSEFTALANTSGVQGVIDAMKKRSSD